MTVIDHLVYGVPDLSAAIADLHERLGVAPAYGGSHPGRGTHNALLGLGPRTYLEVIACDPDQPDDTRVGLRYRLAFDMTPAIVGWAVATTDIDADVARVRNAGADLGDPVAMRRTTADGAVLAWRRTPNDPFPLPFLVDWQDSPHPAGTAPVGVRFGPVRLTHPEPRQLIEPIRALRVDELIAPDTGPTVTMTVDLSGPAGDVTL